MVAFGLLFGAAGLTPDEEGVVDWGAGIMMALFAAVVASLGVALITARATVTPLEIRYRYGLTRRRIRRSDVESISVGSGSGRFYEHIFLHVRVRQHTRPIRLIGLQRADTSSGRAALERVADEVRHTLGA